jgi:hypothetical protein
MFGLQLLQKGMHPAFYDVRIGVGLSREILDCLFYCSTLLESVPDETASGIESCDLITRDIQDGGTILIHDSAEMGKWQRHFDTSINGDVVDHWVLSFVAAREEDA